MGGINRFAFRFAILLTALLLTSGTPMTPECTFSNTSGFCTGMAGRFLLRDHKPDIRVLYIINSDLRALTAKDFAPFRNLETLHINNCSIPIFPEGSILSELGHLKALQITYSKLDQELGRIIVDVPGLTSLSLPGNNISRIDKTLIGHFHHVETIDLSHNDISEVDADVFKGLPELKKLDLSNNKLGEGPRIKKGDFAGLSHVEEIDLSHNQISAVDEGAFSGLRALRRLDLSHNRLGQGFAPAFLSLPGGCAFCARAGERACPAGACPPPAAVDALWRALPGTGVLRLHGNPVCQAVAASSSTSQELCGTTGTSLERDKKDDGECRVREGDSCAEHACRDRFLQGACVETPGSSARNGRDGRGGNEGASTETREGGRQRTGGWSNGGGVSAEGQQQRGVGEGVGEVEGEEVGEGVGEVEGEEVGEGVGEGEGEEVGEGEGVGEELGEGARGGLVLAGLPGVAVAVPLLIALPGGVAVAAVAFRRRRRRATAAAASPAGDVEAHGQAGAGDDGDGHATSLLLLPMQQMASRCPPEEEI